MGVPEATQGRWVAVLATDRDLAGRLPAGRLERAEPLSAARVLVRRCGTWDATQDATHGRDGFGLLVLDGLLVRRVGVEGRYGAELLAGGDLLQPWAHDGEGATLPFEAAWRVLAPLRLAVLDLRWLTRMAPFPEVSAELVTRAMLRSRRLASMMAIASHHRLDARLRLMFWELADRFGRVHPDGVHLDLNVTHELIGHLVGAQRPPVSSALGRLERDGYVRRVRTGWVLLGDPPTREDLAVVESIARA